MHIVNLPDYSIFRLILVLVITVAIAHHVATKYPKYTRIYIYLSSLFICIYSGIGYSYVEVNTVYIAYYTLFYYLFISVFSKIAFGKQNIHNPYYIDYFIFNKKSASLFILGYLLLQLSYSFYPDYNLLLLLNIQSYSLNVDYWKSGSTNSLYIDIIKYLLLLLLPFYFIALYHFKHRNVFLLFLLLVPLYIKIASNGYVARSTVFPYLLIYIGLMFSKTQKSTKRNIFIFTIIIGVTPLLYLLYVLSFLRMGWDTSYITLVDAIMGLISIETTFPLHFNWVYSMEAPIQPMKYLTWLLMLPIPNFIKGSGFDFQINYSLSVDLLNVSMRSEKYYVSLYGMVTNAIYVFGKIFSFIQPIITGIIFGFSYRLISKYKENQILILYFLFFIIFNYARAGDGATLPLVINQFLLLYITILFRRKQKYQ
jgi:hypothetical protein